jgi:hypothetical protein
MILITVKTLAERAPIGFLIGYGASVPAINASCDRII